ncbi:hypothetical protein EPA93_19695 [Ktedonosporobacter rubrisoli]|uniref:Uncharacterized protein n=1 Tax=Ktedonosporobacter rubrisoli TaxID=2509675 RepID=A0A4P6JRK2_KTERU|nr:G1 family glutamic endopeptidase [Ktedonosporobacter rubrisoli]QBD78098.1 hypothetical protein EPA93_19695 [Ktedonosporobacter rubrisoli]
MARSASSAALTQPAIHRFNLPAHQGLRDFAGDFNVHSPSSDTGIAIMPGERVEIFASGSAQAKADGTASGPEGDTHCSPANLPISSLPCEALIYSVSMTGPAGLVGVHTGFVAQEHGNLFLGVNSANLAANNGSFHITVLTIPPGTAAGIWATPGDKFTLQGTSITLAVKAFAQNKQIKQVQFTATLPGQLPVPICNASTPDKDTYTCQWDLILNGSRLSNSPVVFGFTIQSEQGQPLVNPDGVRTGTARYVSTQSTTIYAGYAAINLNGEQGYEKVLGTWNIPQSSCSSHEDSLASFWVGMTGVTHDAKLAQIGADSDCQSGTPHYSVWWEVFPEASVPITKPIHSGDTISASVTFYNGTFEMHIDNTTAGWQFSASKAGPASDTRIAECITEAPTIENTTTHQQSVANLTNFGAVNISCTVNNNVPIGNGPQTVMYQMAANGVTKATTSPLAQNGSTFSVQWIHS